MAKWYWDRMAGIYLDGRRYDLALAPARATAEGTAERWEISGVIVFHPHRFTESRDAYRHVAALSDAGYFAGYFAKYFAGDIRLKADYALTKTKDLAHAGAFFRAALGRSPGNNTGNGAGNSAVAREARHNPACIRRIKDFPRERR